MSGDEPKQIAAVSGETLGGTSYKNAWAERSSSSVDVIGTSAECGCDCADDRGEDDSHPLIVSNGCKDVAEDEFDWTQLWTHCECTECGDGRCRVRCSEILRLTLAQERGLSVRGLVDQVDAAHGVCDVDRATYPKLCGYFRDH